jgi:hypothetical protein
MLIYLTSEEVAAKGEAAAKAHAVVTSEGEADTGMRGGVLATSESLSHDEGDDSCKPASYFALLALLGLADNSMQPPLRDTFLSDARLCHVNGPSDAGQKRTEKSADSDAVRARNVSP